MALACETCLEGLVIDSSIAKAVRERAGNVCEYCRMPQSVHILTFPIDHFIARQHDSPTALENLALSCVRCNSYKGPNIAGLIPDSQELTRLYHPRKDNWDAHFKFQGPEILGISDIGSTTIKLLRMNQADYIALRKSLIAEGLFS